ncbi:hypothetical protein BHE74_00045880 [Ensete ventricosum]|nr:hypothetical protein GW17_00040884 [Ensete ventricosum]RWW48079.1 hypothetical protein BHE74_00045880 [Ensete ventricosum]RZS19630.1 hypothetical protein BHM03_00052048 [Ensete ventricosum]
MEFVFDLPLFVFFNSSGLPQLESISTQMPVRLEKLEKDTNKKQMEMPKSARRSKECERSLTGGRNGIVPSSRDREE